jgi:hypothetical protein
MPCTAADARRFTRKATSATRQKQWADVANGALKGGASDASAIKQANAAVGRSAKKRRAAR